MFVSLVLWHNVVSLVHLVWREGGKIERRRRRETERGKIEGEREREREGE